MNYDKSKIVRQCFIFGRNASEEEIIKGIEWTKIAARKLAKQIGIKRPVESEDVGPKFDQYGPPMYMLSPNSWPEFTYKNARNYNGIGKYEIVIRCQNEMDENRKNWIIEMAAKFNKLGRDAFQKTGNWAPNVMKEVEAKWKEIYGIKNKK